MELRDRLSAMGPKRILAIDGGGIRSLISLGFLERLEALLRERHSNPALRLYEYFDLIGGTSTGAVMAAGLAAGMDMAELKRSYQKLSQKAFGKGVWSIFDLFFKKGPVERELKKIFISIPLGSEELQTGLCIVTKRADTNSAWLFLNHPKDVYYSRQRGILLQDILYAGLGVPNALIPRKISLKPNEFAAFTDAGISMANNPAFQLFQTAVLQGYPFRWPIGENRLMLVSIGAGLMTRRFRVDKITHKLEQDNWKAMAPVLMAEEASRQNQLILQYLSRSATPWEVDRDAGNLTLDLLTAEPALTYLRYDVRLTPEELKGLGFEKTDELLGSLREMKTPKQTDMLLQIGAAAAKSKVADSHFSKTFDLPEPEPEKIEEHIIPREEIVVPPEKVVEPEKSEQIVEIVQKEQAPAAPPEIVVEPEKIEQKVELVQKEEAS